MTKHITLILLLIILPLSVFLFLNKDKYLTNYDYTKNENNQQQLNVDLTSQTGQYQVEFEDINYFNDTIGFYAQPNEDGEFEGVVMIHEWWGLNEHIKEQAKILASHGYRVLAVDLFNSVAENREQAMTQVQSLDQQVALENMSSAIEYLKSRGSTKVASLGWCFGGAQSLQVSLNQNLDATIIYYGNLVTDSQQLSGLKSPVLGIFGDEDTSIPVENVNQFESELNNLNIQNDINIYQGVGHAFANPSGSNYAPEQTLDAWNKTLEFLEQNLQ